MSARNGLPLADVSAAINGLSLTETTIIVRIMELAARNQPMIDDDGGIAERFRISLKEWRQIKGNLLNLKKIKVSCGLIVPTIDHGEVSK